MGFYADDSGVGFDVAVRKWSLTDGVVHAVAASKTMTGSLD